MFINLGLYLLFFLVQFFTLSTSKLKRKYSATIVACRLGMLSDYGTVIRLKATVVLSLHWPLIFGCHGKCKLSTTLIGEPTQSAIDCTIH